MKLDKKQNRQRRARKGRARIAELAANRLTVHRTPRHIYAQVIGPDGGTVLAAASTVEQEVRKNTKSTGNTEAAASVHVSPRKPKPPVSTRLHLIAPGFAITAALKRWPMRHAKLDLNFKD